MTGEEVQVPVQTLMGWCLGNDAYHSLCRKRTRSPFGVESVCSCPGHDTDNGEASR